MSRKFHPLLMSAVVLAVSPSHAAPDRFMATLETNYQGSHPDLFNQQMDRVRSLVRQAPLEITSQLGLLQYREGFRCPLVVRFDDAPAQGVEHAIAYVRFVVAPEGIAQQLVVNLDVWPQSSTDFDVVFYHEMTHAVLNDAVVVPFHQPLPSWVQEGLAVYISGEGDHFVQHTAAHVHHSQLHYLIHDLNVSGPYPDYAADYLAFRYLKDHYGINSLQAFVRDLAQGKATRDSIEDSTGVSWDKFQSELKEFTAKTYEPLTIPG